MTDAFFPPLTKLKPFYPGQWGILGSDSPLGLRTDTRGSVFYVDSGHARANDANTGTDPDAPLMTITQANVRATTNANDFIYVRQLTAALETFPINITKNRVHLISTFYRPGHGPTITPVADTAAITLNADNVELAGFELNGGATHGAIESGTLATWGADIHHNRFGFQGAGQDGIRMAGAVDKPHWTIHNNWFNTNLTRDGIRIDQNSTRSEIWGNVFRRVGGVSINLVSGCTDIYAIFDNRFNPVADAATGGSIFCVAGSGGCMFWGNQSMHDMAAMAQVPYRDLGAGHWGLNYYGLLAIMPVTV
jgi:hypothetical protein